MGFEGGMFFFIWHVMIRGVVHGFTAPGCKGGGGIWDVGGRGRVPAVRRLIEGKEIALRSGDGSPTLSSYPRHHNIYIHICAAAPGGPGSTLHGMTHIHLAGSGRIGTCVPNRNRGLRRRSVILIHNNHIGSLPNIHCRVIHNSLSATNMTNHARHHSGCNTGHPGPNRTTTNTGGGWSAPFWAGFFFCGERLILVGSVGWRIFSV